MLQIVWAVLLYTKKKEINDMSNISNLEMSTAVASHPKVSLKSSLFGLFKTYYYEPSKSELATDQKYLNEDNFGQLSIIANKTDKNQQEMPESLSPIHYSSVCNHRLDICKSEDNNFIALQLFTYKDYLYEPASKVFFFEGNVAQRLAKII